MNMNDLQSDLAPFWMPFTANRQFKQAPRLLAEAKGMYYKTPDKREILDGTAGLVVRGGGSLPRRDRARGAGPGGAHGFRAHLPDGPSAGL